MALFTTGKDRSVAKWWQFLFAEPSEEAGMGDWQSKGLMSNTSAELYEPHTCN